MTGESATVHFVETLPTVELRDLGGLTSFEEVTAAVNIALEGTVETRVFVSWRNWRRQKKATVALTTDGIDKISILFKYGFTFII